jgi:glycosyltransferase involved in cell wall biosynthesis
MVNTFYPPYRGGTETYVSSISRRLVKAGNQVTVYCAQNPCTKGESFDQGVRIVRMRTLARFYGTPLALFPSETLRRDFDVIHCNFPNPYFSVSSALLSWLRDVPSVLTWHNDLPGVTSAASILVGVHEALSTAYLKEFARIIATTRVYAQTSTILRRFSDRLAIIPNGVDTRRFSPGNDGSGVRSELGVTDGEVLVAFVGALTRWHVYKGLEILLAAMKEVLRSGQKVKLMVVGGGELLDHYQRMASGLGISGQVVFVGDVPDELLPNYYAASDLLALPSKNESEGYGIVLLEAMASGKPVVASRIGGMSEVVSNNENGILTPPKDVHGLSSAICSLASNPEARMRIGMNGREFAESHDWDLVTERITKLYRGILSAKQDASIDLEDSAAREMLRNSQGT